MTDYFEANRRSWDERASAHAQSPGYNVADFVRDPMYLSEVVRFDLPRLGEVRGKKGIHLQCHIGTDTVSLARLGADMTGLDFSGASIAEARRLSHVCGTPVAFVEARVDDALSVLPNQTFDFVFTGIGALCWLPDINAWAQVVAGLLKPGGRLFVREGHPMLWATDENCTDQLVINLPYFPTGIPLVDDTPGTYVETDVAFSHNRTYSWNHGLGAIFTALLDNGMVVTQFVEHDSVPWNALPGQMTMEPDGEWRLNTRRERMPLSYTLQCRKLADTA